MNIVRKEDDGEGENLTGIVKASGLGRATIVVMTGQGSWIFSWKIW